jgi:hypothetical protein
MYNITQNNLTIPSKPIVTFKNWYNGIDASFDFSKIPNELHQPMLNLVINDYNQNHKPLVSNKKEDSSLLSILFRKIL